MGTKQNYFGYTGLLLIGALSLGAETYRRANSPIRYSLQLGKRFILGKNLTGHAT